MTDETRHKLGRLLNPLKGEKAIWVIMLILMGISLIAVYSSIGLSAIDVSHTTPWRAFFKHAVFVVVAALGAVVFANFNYRSLSKPVVVGYLLSVVLLIAVYIVGRKDAGSGMGRWFAIPHIGSFQPSELAKVVLVVFVARSLTLAKDSLKEWPVFLTITASILLVVGLILPENLSTALILFGVCYVMMRFADVDRGMWWKTLAGLVVLGALAMLVSTQLKSDADPLARASTWSSRIDNWMHPDPDELNQENMARMAVASGGLLGKGIGTTVHARLMKAAHNDFIYAIIIEEKGLAAGLIIFLLFTTLYFCCIRIAWNTPGMFGRLTVAGLSTLIYIQAVVHMGVNVGALPVTGQTLPFISAGGSSYVFLACAVGIIQSVAADSENKRTKGTRKQKAPATTAKQEKPEKDTTTEPEAAKPTVATGTTIVFDEE